MTFWDNPQMVINHIRHSCVTSDDTGMCEMVIVQDEPDIFNMKQRKRLGVFNSDEGSDYSDYSQSFDIAVSPGVMGRTSKSNRFDKARKNKQEIHCKNIHWDESKAEKITEDERKELFEEKTDLDASNKTSALSQMLQDSLNKPSNAFIQYSKYDGEGLEGTCATKMVEFFLTFLPMEDLGFPSMEVTFIETACVQDVIGLVLYKYTLEGKLPKLQDDIKAYSLHIADDDGDVDTDFPALDDKDSMAKFDFPHLAIVEKHKASRDREAPVKNSVSVKIMVPHGYSIVKVDRTDVKMKVILAKLLKKRGIKEKKNGPEYRLEKHEEEDQTVDLDTTLESTGTLTFNLARENGGRKKDEKDIQTKTTSAQAEIMSLQYKSYQVLLVHRLLASTEVSLGIHGKKIEIDPLAQPKSQKFFTRVKLPVSLDMDIIADCEITDEKPGRAVFRIHYKKVDDFKHYEFETTPKSADEICRKIHCILESRSQVVRAEYLKKRALEKNKRR